MAWLRTGIAVIGLGFLVARFGVFLMIVRGETVEGNQLTSSLIGIGFVLFGTLMIAAATWQHQRFCKCLSSADLPKHYSTRLSLGVSVLVSISGLLLAMYLTLSVSMTMQW